jgi:hypothetical protein
VAPGRTAAREKAVGQPIVVYFVIGALGWRSCARYRELIDWQSWSVKRLHSISLSFSFLFPFVSELCAGEKNDEDGKGEEVRICSMLDGRTG